FSRNRQIALRQYGHRCAQCGIGGVLHVHHIIPRARGGSNDLSNLVPLCPTCHALAHRRH
ncbi:MAG: HNH endonuclease, partial [Thermomicrobia bacterium]|nr:HNH endonuclease [Thermomicrobia bacterium]